MNISPGNIEISLSPSLAQLCEIKEWLRQEDALTKEGFYCNWSLINMFFEKKCFAAISFANLTIGFITWRTTSQLTANIHILEINPNFRKKGYGKVLVKKVLSAMIKTGIYAVDLQAQPFSSSPFWKSLGFIEVPKKIRHWHFAYEYFYKIMISTVQPSQCSDDEERIELWEHEPDFTNGKPPNWQWRFSLPIVHPAEQDWRIRWIKGDKTLIDTKVKYFADGNSYFAPFLIISGLPALK